jgi:hypothetical protein
VLRGVIGVIIGVIALAAFAAGCGGSDESSLTRAEFVKQGDAICFRAEEQKGKDIQAAINSKYKQSINKESVQEEMIVDVALPPIVEMTEELKELGTPEGAEEQYDELISFLEEEAKEIEEEPAIALDPAKATFPKSDRTAREMGMKECSQI